MRLPSRTTLVWCLVHVALLLLQCRGADAAAAAAFVNASQLYNSTALNEFTELVYERISSLTYDLIHSQITRKASFCITNPEDDWNRAFNYSSNLGFLSNCLVETQ
ncbi:hypothetical protein M569_04005, partial [Genlisea aurea]